MKGLLHYRQLNTILLLGVIVAGAVLTGALTVGDSVRQSLRVLTLDRLGTIDSVIASEHFVAQALAEKMASQPQVTNANALMMLKGAVRGEQGLSGKVQVFGVTPAFANLFPEGEIDEAQLSELLNKDTGQLYPSAVMNQSLANELGATVGSELIVSFESVDNIHRDSVYGRKDREDVILKARVTLKAIIADKGFGRFSLASGQGAPYNIFLPLKQLQRTLKQRGKVNAVFIDDRTTHEAELADMLRTHLSLSDLNLELSMRSDYFSLDTPGYFLKEYVVEHALEVAKELALDVVKTSAYLVNDIKAGEKQTPYSLMAAVDGIEPPIQKDQVYVSQWLADDLGVSVGDALELTWYGVNQDESLYEEHAPFTVGAILPMENLMVDRFLAPKFPGIDDADDIADWDPPFPMELERIRQKDEDFWDDHKTSPKLLLSPEMARTMWESRFGFQTGIRFYGNVNEAKMKTFEEKLLSRLEPEQCGITSLSVMLQGLQASKGATDFSGLFVGVSFFIIASAAILIGLFFRLGVEQRRSEVGILLAIGYPLKKVSARFQKEGLLIAAVGAILGVVGGLGYGAIMMKGLREWWSLGTSELYFHPQPLSLVIGVVATVFVAFISLWTTTRKLSKVDVSRLVSGGDLFPPSRSRSRASRVMMIFLVLGLLQVPIALMSGQALMLFFGVGICFMISGLGFLGHQLSDSRKKVFPKSLWDQARRNAARHSGRTLSSVTLIACACFIISAVSLTRHTGEDNPDLPSSGTGGNFLEAQSSVPIHHDLSSVAGQLALGLGDESSALLKELKVNALRLRGGDDASCLNLYAPKQPRILGLNVNKPTWGGFSFQQSLAKDEQNPWSLLEEPTDDGTIPVIGDANSVMWILRSGLGKEFVIQDAYGKDVRLKFVGLLSKSIFQSELIISEQHFKRLFPDEAGYGYFLFAGQHEQRETLASFLENELDAYGFDTTSTSAKLMRFHEIENTYISIFQLLGGLGMLLGTFGLAAIIYRNVLERKGEFAIMRSFGFQKQSIGKLLLMENAIVLVWGIAIGVISALIAVFPHLLQNRSQPDFVGVGLTLVAVFAMGMFASLSAVRLVSRQELLPALRGE